jgi:hypothetical protein
MPAGRPAAMRALIHDMLQVVPGQGPLARGCCRHSRRRVTKQLGSDSHPAGLCCVRPGRASPQVNPADRPDVFQVGGRLGRLPTEPHGRTRSSAWHVRYAQRPAHALPCTACPCSSPYGPIYPRSVVAVLARRRFSFWPAFPALLRFGRDRPSPLPPPGHLPPGGPARRADGRRQRRLDAAALSRAHAAAAAARGPTAPARPDPPARRPAHALPQRPGRTGPRASARHARARAAARPAARRGTSPAAGACLSRRAAAAAWRLPAPARPAAGRPRAASGTCGSAAAGLAAGRAAARGRAAAQPLASAPRPRATAARWQRRPAVGGAARGALCPRVACAARAARAARTARTARTAR